MKSIREVLAPLLIISYVCGLRLWIIELPTFSRLRSWFSVSYMLLFWLIYFFFLKFTVKSYINDITVTYDSTDEVIYYWLEIFMTLLSVVFGIYHNKVRKFWHIFLLHIIIVDFNCIF